MRGTDLVEVAGSPDRPDLVCVVEEPHAGLGQTVPLPDLDVSKAPDKLPPHVGPQAAAHRQPHAVSPLLGDLVEKPWDGETTVAFSMKPHCITHGPL